MALDILYEDNHLLVVNKPAGMIVQGSMHPKQSLLEAGKDYLRKKYDKPGKVFLGVVSRLDQPVTGVVPYARTSKAAARLSEQFRERRVEKNYLALVEGRWNAAKELHHWVIRDDAHAITRTFDHEVPGASIARMRVSIVDMQSMITKISIELETGRKHQIRAQCAEVNHPIIGDVKYGATIPFPKGIALHCEQVTLQHPTREETMTFRADLPDYWIRTFNH